MFLIVVRPLLYNFRRCKISLSHYVRCKINSIDKNFPTIWPFPLKIECKECWHKNQLQNFEFWKQQRNHDIEADFRQWYRIFIRFYRFDVRFSGHLSIAWLPNNGHLQGTAENYTTVKGAQYASLPPEHLNRKKGIYHHHHKLFKSNVEHYLSCFVLFVRESSIIYSIFYKCFLIDIWFILTELSFYSLVLCWHSEGSVKD